MHESQTVLVAGYIRVPPDKLPGLRPHIETYVAFCRREDGCVHFSFAEDLCEPGLIRVFEIWNGSEALERHKNSVHVAAWRALWPEYGVHGRSMSRYAIASEHPF
jgi:quinol monooxygenase YgiN